MKKRIGIFALGASLIVIFVLMVTVKETGKKDTPPLGYQDVDTGDIFETGRLEGDFDLEPVSDEFIDFDDFSEDAVARYKKRSAGQTRGLGLIPSPVPAEVYQGVQAKALDAKLYDDVYDLRDPNNDGNRSDSLLPPVREQWDCGACWAFATYGGVEGGGLSKIGYAVDYSENHALFSSGYDWGGCSGGNVDMSMAYLSRHGGPINENDSPFSRNPRSTCKDCAPVRYIDSVIKLKVRSTVSDIAYIKQALLDYGPLYASMNWSDQAYHPEDYTYYSDMYSTNHAVTLVGWDDHKHVAGASSPGVFIARNSWGSDWGEAGYFYVSYDDRSFAFSSLVAFVDEPDSLLDFDRVYYHDDLGMTSSTGNGGHSAWGACAFTPDKDGTLVAVGLFTTAFDTRYEFRVYGRLNQGQMEQLLLGPISGSLTGKGYHTLKFNQVLPLEKGDDFIIAVNFETPSSTWPVPLEKPFPDYSSAATANSGESFLSSDGIDWRDTITVFPETSVCIKAFVREKTCSGDLIQVSGAGDQTDFMIRNKEGALVMAVVTDDCGDPVYDAEVIAKFTTGDSDMVLYDDGQHHDGTLDDGIYANGFEKDTGQDSSTVMVKAVKENREAFMAGETKHTKSEKGAGSSGCFIGEILL